MIWLNIYIIGFIVAFIGLTILDALVNKSENVLFKIIAYSLVWPFYLVYGLINSIVGD
jgi:hypothetical protein